MIWFLKWLMPARIMLMRIVARERIKNRLRVCLDNCKGKSNLYGGKGGIGMTTKAYSYNKRKIRKGQVNNAFLNSLD
jgi:hypothetical protein